MVKGRLAESLQQSFSIVLNHRRYFRCFELDIVLYCWILYHHQTSEVRDTLIRILVTESHGTERGIDRSTNSAVTGRIKRRKFYTLLG